MISFNNVTFSWDTQKPLIAIPDLTIQDKEHLFIHGPSGSGKSTLLGLISGILTPQQGDIHILNQSLNALTTAQKDQFRVDHIGFIFQQFNLIPYLSILENVILPCHFSTVRRKRVVDTGKTPTEEAQQLLTRLDLSQTLWNKPVHQLSIGQQQRVAAARALIGTPEIVLADEPTSALDADRQQHFLDLIQHISAENDITFIFISHDLRLAEHFPRQLSMQTINQAQKAVH